MSQISDGNPAYMSMDNLCLNGFITSWRYDTAVAQDAVEIWAKFVMVPAYGQPIPIPSSMLGWEIHVWESLQALHTSPFRGTQAHLLVSQPDLGSPNVPIGYGTGGAPVYAVGFSLPGIQLQPGRDYRFSIRAIGSSGPYPQCEPQTPVAAIQKTGGCPAPSLGGDGIAYSEAPQPGWPNVHWNTTRILFGSSCGELATKIVTAVPSMFGDMNCDGNVNMLDRELFLTAFHQPQNFPSGEGACSLWNADFNGDRIIDGSDFARFELLMPG